METLEELLHVAKNVFSHSHTEAFSTINAQQHSILLFGAPPQQITVEVGAIANYQVSDFALFTQNLHRFSMRNPCFILMMIKKANWTLVWMKNAWIVQKVILRLSQVLKCQGQSLKMTLCYCIFTCGYGQVQGT